VFLSIFPVVLSIPSTPLRFSFKVRIQRCWPEHNTDRAVRNTDFRGLSFLCGEMSTGYVAEKGNRQVLIAKFYVSVLPEGNASRIARSEAKGQSKRPPGNRVTFSLRENSSNGG
jgi:hypothetical protein